MFASFLVVQSALQESAVLASFFQTLASISVSIGANYNAPGRRVSDPLIATTDAGGKDITGTV